MSSKLTPGYPALNVPLQPQVSQGSDGVFLGSPATYAGYASAAITLAGTPVAGGSVVTTINGHAVTYALVAGDTTTALVATHVAAAINADTPSSLIVSAAAVGSVVTVTALATGATGNYSLSVKSYAAGTLTMGGTPADTNTVVATIAGHAVTYTLDTSDTTTAIVATHVATTINNDSTDAAIVLATAVGSVVQIASLASGTTGNYSLTTSVTGGGVTSTASDTQLDLVTVSASAGQLNFANSTYIAKTTFAWRIHGGPKTFYAGVAYPIDPTNAAAMLAAGLIY